MQRFSRLRNVLNGALLTLAALSLGLYPQARAEEQAEPYSIKAAFVLNFLRLTELPAAGPEVALCVYGGDAVQSAFSKLDRLPVQGGRVAYRQIKPESASGGCSVMFISSSTQDPDPLRLAPPGCLTIGESNNFIQRGGVVRFFTEEDRIRFEINFKEGTVRRLVFSSQLLRLARIVSRED